MNLRVSFANCDSSVELSTLLQIVGASACGAEIWYVAPSNMKELMHLYVANTSDDEAFLLSRLDARLRLLPPDYDMGIPPKWGP